MVEKQFGSPNVTKDGVWLQKEIELEDRLENVGSQWLKEVKSKHLMVMEQQHKFK